MVTIPTDELPSTLKRLADAAGVVGWSVSATRATVDELTTVALRFAHDRYRAYGVWALGTTANGKPSAKWRAGASRSGRFFGNLADLRTYLGVS